MQKTRKDTHLEPSKEVEELLFSVTNTKKENQ